MGQCDRAFGREDVCLPRLRKCREEREESCGIRKIRFKFGDIRYSFLGNECRHHVNCEIRVRQRKGADVETERRRTMESHEK